MSKKNFDNELNMWCDTLLNNTKIPMEKFDNYKVKRGLRNSDGTGVLAGLTNIGNVHGYVTSDDDRIPSVGKNKIF